MSPLEHEVARRLEEHGVAVSSEQRGQLTGYLGLLRQWNAKMNLTTLESGDAALDRLIVEPAVAAASIDRRATHLLDVGSGGGSPAIPLKIMRPDLLLTMVEVRARKSVFLREAARHIGLSATTVETAKFEDVLASSRQAKPVDVISVRAVRLEPAHLELCANALSESGQMLWFLSELQVVGGLPTKFGIEGHRDLVRGSGSQLLILRRSAPH